MNGIFAVLFLLSLVISMVNSCVQYRPYVLQRMEQLQQGMSYDEVISIMMLPSYDSISNFSDSYLLQWINVDIVGISYHISILFDNEMKFIEIQHYYSTST